MVKKSLLADGEQVVFTAHSHWKNLVGPVLVTLLAAAAVTFVLLVLVPDPTAVWQRWVIAGLGAVVVLVFAVWPFLVWLASTDTLTTHRLISRRGVLTREGKDIPIDRVHSVSYRQSVVDRVLGCGTLVVQTAGHDSDIELYDVARIERRILQMQEVVLDEQIPAEGDDDPEAT